MIMELHELKNCIDSALAVCQSMIHKNPILVWSESDFERLLCNCITQVICGKTKNKQAPEFSIHTQISHYVDGKAHLDIRPDILLLKDQLLKKAIDDYIPNKKGIYEGPSIAIELKYLHIGKGTSVVEHDFSKWISNLNEETWLYVVVLLDIPRNPGNTKHFENKEATIYQYQNAMIEKCSDDRNKIHCKVLKKII